MKATAKKRAAKRWRLLGAVGERKLLERVRKAELEVISLRAELVKSGDMAGRMASVLGMNLGDQVKTNAGMFELALPGHVCALNDRVKALDATLREVDSARRVKATEASDLSVKLAAMRQLACRAGPTAEGLAAFCASPEDAWKVRAERMLETSLELKNLRALAAELEVVKASLADAVAKLFAIHQFAHPSVGANGKPKNPPALTATAPQTAQEDGA